MSQERTEALVLRAVDFSNTSRIVTFLTPDRGRLACLATGARRPKSPLNVLLDTFNRLELVYYWKDGRAVQKLAEASLLEAFSGIKADLEKTMFGAFGLELAGKVAHENEPSERLFATLVHGLHGLNAWEGDIRHHAAWQSMQLLIEAGFEPALTHCAECGKELAIAKGFKFLGGAVCANCPADRPISPETHAALRALSESRDTCPPARAARETFGLLREFAAHQLETSFRSLRVIDQVFA